MGNIQINTSGYNLTTTDQKLFFLRPLRAQLHCLPASTAINEKWDASLAWSFVADGFVLSGRFEDVLCMFDVLKFHSSLFRNKYF